MRPSGIWAALFRARVRLARKRAGMTRTRFELDCTRFRPGGDAAQLPLFPES
jgi:hypothetical protein